MESVNGNLLWMITGTFAALIIGTTIRLIALRNSATDVVRQRMASLKVWWVLALLWSVAAWVGQVGAAILLGIASLLAMREYLRLIDKTEKIGRGTLASLLVVGVVHYGLIAGNEVEIAKWFVPITLLLLLGIVRVVTGSPENYIRVTGGVYWGGLLIIYGLSHSLFLFNMESTSIPMVGIAGWFLFVVLVSEMNDIMQAIVGRKFGKRMIMPRISPHKTYEGLIGGLLTSILLSVLLAPYMTTFTAEKTIADGVLLSVTAGVLISLAGFAGDVNMSAIKRDAGVKDGSTLLPGMGGMIDRIDSLTFSGPVFYYFVELLNHFNR